RSAIFYTSDEQKQIAEDTIADVNASGLWPGKVVTEVTAAGPFWEAEPEHQDYLERYPNGYTCHYIRPGGKLPRRQEQASARHTQVSCPVGVDGDVVANRGAKPTGCCPERGAYRCRIVRGIGSGRPRGQRSGGPSLLYKPTSAGWSCRVLRAVGWWRRRPSARGWRFWMGRWSRSLCRRSGASSVVGSSYCSGSLTATC